MILQVQLDPKTADKIGDENGEINKDDFFKFALDTKLLDFGSAMGESASLGSLLSKSKKLSVTSTCGDRRPEYEVKSISDKADASKKQKKVEKVPQIQKEQ